MAESMAAEPRLARAQERLTEKEREHLRMMTAIADRLERTVGPKMQITRDYRYFAALAANPKRGRFVGDDGCPSCDC